MFVLQMDSEVPCRDTDPEEAPNKLLQNETVAFTINFGEKLDEQNLTKKFERFAQRSSQRRINSPKQRRSSNSEIKSNLKETEECGNQVKEGNVVNDVKTKEDAASTSGTYTREEDSEVKKVSSTDKKY